MIKRFYEITIRDWDILERTGNIGHLLRWYNPFPSRFFANKVARELNKLAVELNDTNKDNDFIYQVESLVKIEIIRVNYLGVVNIINNQTSANFFLGILRSRRKRIRDIKSPNLSRYIAELKKITGIDVKTIKDVERIKRDLQFRIDKYNESYAQHLREQNNKTYLMTIALGVFSYLNMPFNPQITVLEFIEAKKKAEDESAKQRANQLKYQN